MCITMLPPCSLRPYLGSSLLGASMRGRMTAKTIPITAAAPAVPTSPSTLRRLEELNVVHPVRDVWNRRLYGADDIEAARAHLKKGAATQRSSGAAPA
jgi:hypothetical protein